MIIILIQVVSCSFNVYNLEDNVQLLKNASYAIANFGNAPYGQGMTGAIYLPPTRETNQNLDQYHMCGTLAVNQYNSYFSYIQSKWLIVRRGECSDTRKALNAQSIGAALLIIVSDQEEDVDHAILKDDGSGFKVSIPVILISKQDGQVLYDNLIAQYPGGMLRGQLKFQSSESNDTLKVMFGLSIGNRETFRLIQNFKQFYDELKDYVDFDIFYDLLECNRCKSEGFIEEQKDCIQNGRYCQLDPDAEESGNGADVVKEQFRQLCLWQSNKTHWWNYMNYFTTQCTKPNLFEQCFKLFITDQIYTDVMLCYNHNTNSPIPLLDTQFEQKIRFGMVYFPGVTINGKLQRESVEAVDIKNAICSSLKDNEQLAGCLVEDILIQRANTKSYIWLSIIVLITIMCFVFFIIFVFRRMLKTQMKEELNQNVKDAISRYSLHYGE